MRLEEISKEEYEKLPFSVKLLEQSEFPRKFALLTVNEFTEPIALCWSSESVKPQIVLNDWTPLLWCGIDQQIVAFDKNTGKIKLTLSLTSNLLEIIMTENSIILRNELEIYSFSLDGFLQNFHYLPEVSESIIINDATASVTLIDGETLSLRI
jgi:hypothetical protein